MVAHLLRLKLHLLRNGLRRSVPQLVGMVAGGALRARGGRPRRRAVWWPCGSRPTSELARSVVVRRSAVRRRWAGSSCRCCSAGSTRPSTRRASRPSPCPGGSCSRACSPAALVGIPGVVTVRARADDDGHLVALAAGGRGGAGGRRGGRADLRHPQPDRPPRASRRSARAGAVGRWPPPPAACCSWRPGLGSGWIGEQAQPRRTCMALRRRGAGLDAVRPGLGRARPTSRPGALGTGLVRLRARRPRPRPAARPVGRAAASGAGEPPLGQRAHRWPGRRRPGWFARLPGTPTGAVAARAVTYWRRDARYVVAIGMTPLLPLVLLVPAARRQPDLAARHGAGRRATCSAGACTTTSRTTARRSGCTSSTGVAGARDRLGRLAPTAVLGAVVVPGYAVLSSALTGRLVDAAGRPGRRRGAAALRDRRWPACSAP